MQQAKAKAKMDMAQAEMDMAEAKLEHSNVELALAFHRSRGIAFCF